MALKTQIRGTTQIMPLSITDAEIATAAAIKTSKLEDGASFFWKDGSVAATASFNMAGFKIGNLGGGTADNEAVNFGQLKAAVSAATSGLDTKQSVRLATTGNIALDGTVPSIDGIVLAEGDRVLVKDQVNQTENGVYVASLLGAWVRADDADTSAKVTAGLYTFVEEGIVNQDSGWILITDGTVTLGTSNLVFTQFTGLGQIDAGDGLTKTANRLDVGAGLGIQADLDSITVKIDGSTLSKSITGLKVAVDGITATEIAPDAVEAQHINADVVGAGLTQTGTGALAVDTDGTSLTISGLKVAINAGGVTETHLNTSVAGDGLVGGGGTPLAINLATNEGLQIVADKLGVLLDTNQTLQVTAAGIKLKDLPTAQILIGDATNVATARAMSGDATLASDGTLTMNKAVVMLFDNYYEETPNTLDRTTYTLAYEPHLGTENVYVNGLRQKRGITNDYVIDYVAKTVVFSSANQPPDDVTVTYFKN